MGHRRSEDVARKFESNQRGERTCGRSTMMRQREQFCGHFKVTVDLPKNRCMSCMLQLIKDDYYVN